MRGCGPCHERQLGDRQRQNHAGPDCQPAAERHGPRMNFAMSGGVDESPARREAAQDERERPGDDQGRQRSAGDEPVHRGRPFVSCRRRYSRHASKNWA